MYCLLLLMYGYVPAVSIVKRKNEHEFILVNSSENYLCRIITVYPRGFVLHVYWTSGSSKGKDRKIYEYE